MATLLPFRALRPRPAHAPQIAAVPYDVVNADEARRSAEGNPLSFLRVSRAEIELPAGTDPYGDAVYARAAQNFAALKEGPLVVEAEPSVYVYRLRQGTHEQTGLAACFSLDEYDRDIIKKHERTRRDKEDDRTHHMLALRAQTGPVFLTYRASRPVDALIDGVTAGTPLFDFEADDLVQHTIWRVGGAERDALASAFADIPTLYIADGHHRAASAARARQTLGGRGPSSPGKSPGTSGASTNGGADSMLAVAFPHDQVRILAYNRVVRDLGGLSPARFLDATRERFTVRPGPPTPERRGEISMYLQGEWRTLVAKGSGEPSDVIASLDVSVLQDRLLAPVLEIVDVRTDPRIDFVGGARGTTELQARVDSGRAAAAFSLFPVSIDDLMAVADQGGIMPPKSTWFEPKLRDGLLVHVI